MCNRRNSTIQPGNKEINDLLMQQINNHGSVRQIFENRHLSPFIPAGPLNQYGKALKAPNKLSKNLKAKYPALYMPTICPWIMNKRVNRIISTDRRTTG